jgi:hypothetical protein
VTDRAIIWREYRGTGHGVQPHPGFPSLGALLDALAALGVTTAWCDPHADPLAGVRAAPTPWATAHDGWEVFPAAVREGQLNPWVNGRQTGPPLTLAFGFSASDWLWPDPRTEPDPVSRAHTQLAGFALTASALGYPLRGTPSLVGRRLAAETNRPRRQDWWRAAEGDYLALAGLTQPVCVDWSWRRALLPAERAALATGGALHVFDKRAAWLAAVQALTLPMGEPTLAEAPPFEPSRNALWDVTLRWPPSSPWQTPALAGITYAQPGRRWLWTPMLAFLARQGAAVEVHQAVRWPEQHKVLDTWAARLWQARRALETAPASPAAGCALAAIKAIYTQTLGLLGHRGATGGAVWQQLAWWELVRAEGAVRQWVLLRQLGAAGYPPLYCATDALGVILPAGADLTALLPLDPGRLGSFREEWQGSGPDVRTALDTPHGAQLTQAGRTQYLPPIAREE